MKKCGIFLLVSCLYQFAFAQMEADSLLNFIKTNPDKSALYLVQNDTAIAKLNENKMMPLASTVKILVAIEFAKQAAQNVFDENSYVAISELDKYYIPNTDGDAHPSWIAYETQKGNIKNDSVSLINVARGMMMFSSNANTEYLMDLLGMDNVKNNIQLLGIKNHTAVYPIVASLFLYQNPKQKNEDLILKGIKKLTEEQYARFSYDIHRALTYDSTLKPKFRPQDLSEKMQRTWSDRLPSSNVKEYAQIANILNNRRYFDTDTYGILAEVMEFIMENPANRSWLKHAGMKGGSTLWVLTKTLYATTAKGDRIELAYFFNDLPPQQNMKMQEWMNAFELQVLTNESFRKKVVAAFKK